MDTNNLLVQRRFSAGFNAYATVDLKSTKGHPLQNYHIWGNSVQDGTPTVADPVTIQSVGDELAATPGTFRIPIDTLSGITNIDIATGPLRKVGDVADQLNYKGTPILSRKIKSVTLAAGTHTLSDAANNSPFLCSVMISGTLSGKSITIPAGVTSCEVIYQLATPASETLTMPQILVYPTTTEVSVNTEISPSKFEVEYRSANGYITPQVGMIVYVQYGQKKWKWKEDLTLAEKATAVGVIFAIDGDTVYIVGNGNNTSKQWSSVADYEITAIPSTSGSYTVTLNGASQGSMTYTRSDGSISEFTTQLETFLRSCDPSSKAAKWEAYTNSTTGKSYLQMFNYNEYESTVTVQGCTLSKLIGSELAPYTNSTIHNQIGQSMNYWCGMCRQRIEEYCTNSGSNPSTAMDGVTQLHPANSAPCSKAYYDGALGVNLRAHYPTYGEYMDACMVKLDKNGNDIMKWWDGKYYTSLLAAKTVLKQGVETPAYAAADYCIKYDGGQPGFRAGDWFLPSFYQEGLLMKDIRGDKQDLVNKALTFLGWQTISTTSHRWSSARYSTCYAWDCSDSGHCYSYYFYYSFTVSVVSAFTIPIP